MKLLVFAHVPPPVHGQSLAVKVMLEQFGSDRRHRTVRRQPPNRYGIECYHVDARFSRTMEDVGELQMGKVFLSLFYCLQAIWCRWRYGVKNLYYVPAPGKAVAVYRDWLILFFCRPFFKTIIFHWHGGGLAKWLETAVQGGTRSLTYRLMKDADLSIVLTAFGRRDAEKLMPRRIAVIGNGVPDPCPDFDNTVLPRRRARAAAVRAMLAAGPRAASSAVPVVNILFIATCARDKGLFDAVEGVDLANQAARDQDLPLRFCFTVAGTFASAAEEKELRDLIRQRRLQDTVRLVGFIFGDRKDQELRDADIFCFPTYYPAEGQPTCLAEAMAYGLPLITTRWRAVPDMLPDNYPGLVDIKSPNQIAENLRLLSGLDLSEPLRSAFLSRFTLEQHLGKLSDAMKSVMAEE